MVIILGISYFYHDSAACIIRDGKVIAAAEEERFSRKKNDNGFPKQAADYCLREAGIAISDVDYCSFYEKPLLKFERMMSSYARTYPFSSWSFFKAIPSWITEKMRIRKVIRKKLRFKGEVFFVPHHLSHAASAFFCSPFRESAITHVDGTARLQTVTWEDNPLFYQLISEFGRIKKVPVVLNTSFNVRGMPIVCSPKDAYECFIKMGIDYLIMDGFLVGK
jgi:carbamoyltransferase